MAFLAFLVHPASIISILSIFSSSTTGPSHWSTTSKQKFFAMIPVRFPACNPTCTLHDSASELQPILSNIRASYDGVRLRLAMALQIMSAYTHLYSRCDSDVYIMHALIRVVGIRRNFFKHNFVEWKMHELHPYIYLHNKIQVHGFQQPGDYRGQRVYWCSAHYSVCNI